MSMKNDLSFLIDARLSLYEHQSTYSPNLSLRFLFYLSDMFSGMTMNANLYGTKRVVLPVPRFVVFYNGEADQPDRKILKLSDLYTVKEEEPMLDLKVLVLNVNQGHNPELMEACRTLWEYAEYTGRVRRVRQRTAHCGGSGADHHRMYPGGDSEGVLGEESQGGEEREYL